MGMEGFRSQPSKSEKPKSHVSESELIRQAWEGESNGKETRAAEVAPEQQQVNPEVIGEGGEKIKKQPEEAWRDSKERALLKEKTNTLHGSLHRFGNVLFEMISEGVPPGPERTRRMRLVSDALLDISTPADEVVDVRNLLAASKAFKELFSDPSTLDVANDYNYKNKISILANEAIKDAEDLKDALWDSNRKEPRSGVQAINSLVWALGKVVLDPTSR